LRDNSYYNQFKSIGSGSVNWSIGPWSTTLYAIRYGKTWSYNGSYTVAPWVKYNASVLVSGAVKLLASDCAIR